MSLCSQLNKERKVIKYKIKDVAYTADEETGDMLVTKGDRIVLRSLKKIFPINPVKMAQKPSHLKAAEKNIND